MSDDLGERKDYIQSMEKNMSSEALARKARSIEVLKSENIPFIDHLPVIETQAESTRRSTEDVAIRAIVLAIVAVKGEGLEQEIVEKLVDDYGISGDLTPKEKAFIENPNPSQHDKMQFVWRYEGYAVMLWALGFTQELGGPDTIMDVAASVEILQQNTRESFIEKAELRSQGEILDAADLIYRYHWAIVNARVNGEETPAGLDGSIVLERHYALNWLVGYMDQAWDDISTDT